MLTGSAKCTRSAFPALNTSTSGLTARPNSLMVNVGSIDRVLRTEVHVIETGVRRACVTGAIERHARTHLQPIAEPHTHAERRHTHLARPGQAEVANANAGIALSAPGRRTGIVEPRTELAEGGDWTPWRRGPRRSPTKSSATWWWARAPLVLWGARCPVRMRSRGLRVRRRRRDQSLRGGSGVSRPTASRRSCP